MLTVERKSRIPDILGNLEILAGRIFLSPERGQVRGKKGRMVTLVKTNFCRLP